ncbi:MAG: hypothetical protein IJ371_01905 [Clostridia bacterium]|nr:hypothetical protein [Clostridia bacterium]
MAEGTNYSAGNLEFVVQEISDKTISKLDLLQGKLQTILNTLSNVSSLTRNLGTTVGRTSSSNSSGGASSNIKDTNKELKVSSISMTKLINKVYFLRNYTKQMFRSVSDIVNKAVDYTETLNLWQVAMRGNTAEAENFVKTMNKAYGIATQTLMEYQAIFKNMLSSLGGISGDTSYALSEYLTQMAIDYASLYNISIERAMTTFQSVLSGQVRPIRSIAGYDITETTIYQLYQQLGGTKTMRQLSQTEKRLLRIYAVFQQMESSGAIGDLGKTMGSTANQMRMFTEQTKEFGTWVGLIFESWLRPILPKLNAFMITLTNITKAYAQLNNIKPQEFGAVESMEQLDEVMDEVQGKLLSFDRFEALNSSADSNILGIDANLLAGLSKYSTILGNVTGEAQTLAEQWTAIFINPETGEFTETANTLWTILKGILVTLSSILALKFGVKVLTFIGELQGGLGVLSQFKGGISGIKDSLALLSLSKSSGLSLAETATGVGGVSSSVMGLSKVLGFLTSPLGIVLSILGVLYSSNEEFRESINELFSTLSPLISLVAGLLTDILKPLMPLISGLVDIIGGALSYVIKAFNVSLSISMLELIPFAYVLEFVLKILQSIVQALGDIATFNWSNFGKNQKEIWSNWKSNEFAKSSWSNFKGSFGAFKTGGRVEDGLFTMNKGEIMGTFDDGSSIVANNQQIISGIKQGVYSAVVSAMKQTNGGNGDVILDGKKVGVYTSKYSHNENVRTGRVRATAY